MKSEKMYKQQDSGLEPVLLGCGPNPDPVKFSKDVLYVITGLDYDKTRLKVKDFYRPIGDLGYNISRNMRKIPDGVVSLAVKAGSIPQNLGNRLEKYLIEREEKYWSENIK